MWSSTDAVEVIAARLGAAAPPAGVQTKFVAIDGFGGAGKTTLAVSLSAKLGGVPITHTDDFASWEEPLEWWPRMLAEVLVPLAARRRARYRRHDWERRCLGDWREIEPSECVIVEGVSSSREAFRPYLTVAVWVEAPREERLRRGLERDGHDALPQWEQWMAREDEYAAHERPQEHAHVVVSGVR
jgi:uridine kinase